MTTKLALMPKPEDLIQDPPQATHDAQALVAASRALPIQNAGDAEAVAVHLDACNLVVRFFTGLYPDVIASAHGLHKELIAKRDGLIGGVNRAAKQDRALLSDWARRQEEERRRKLREEEARIEREREASRQAAEAENQRRRQAAEEAAAAEAAENAALLRDMGEEDTAERLLATPAAPVEIVEVAPVAPMPAYIAPVTLPAGISARGRLVARVDDLGTFLRACADDASAAGLRRFIEVRQGELNRWAARTDGGAAIPGVMVERDTGIASRR